MDIRATSAGWERWLALLGMCFVLILVPLVPGREELAGIPLDKVILSVPIAILLTVPLLTKLGRFNLPRVGIELPALAFLGWALVSAVVTGAQAEVLATWVRYAAYILLVYAVATVATNKSHLRLMAWIMSIAGSMTAVYGFYQYLNPTQFIGMEGMDSNVATRVFSTFGNPNFYAEYLVLLIAVTLGLFFTESGRFRYLAIALVAAQSVALMLTYTRGSWIALVIGVAIALLMVDARRIVPFAIGGAAIVMFLPGVMARIASIASLEGTASFRLGLWRVAGEAILERPIFGIGMGRFYDAFTAVTLNNPEHNIGFLYYGAHQSYFQLTAEIGIFGGLAFAWLVFSACRMGAFFNVRMDEDTRAKWFNACLTAGMIAFALNAFTSNTFQHPQAAVFFFVLAGLQAGHGLRFWAVTPKDSVLPARDEAWSPSRFGRAYQAGGRFVASVWTMSWFRRMLTKEPFGGARFLAHSFLARTLIGDGRCFEQLPPHSDERLAPEK